MLSVTTRELQNGNFSVPVSPGPTENFFLAFDSHLVDAVSFLEIKQRIFTSVCELF